MSDKCTIVSTNPYAFSTDRTMIDTIQFFKLKLFAIMIALVKASNAVLTSPFPDHISFHLDSDLNLSVGNLF